MGASDPSSRSKFTHPPSLPAIASTLPWQLPWLLPCYIPTRRPTAPIPRVWVRCNSCWHPPVTNLPFPSIRNITHRYTMHVSKFNSNILVSRCVHTGIPFSPYPTRQYRSSSAPSALRPVRHARARAASHRPHLHTTSPTNLHEAPSHSELPPQCRHHPSHTSPPPRHLS